MYFCVNILSLLKERINRIGEKMNLNYKAQLVNNKIVRFEYINQGEIMRMAKGHFFDKSSMRFFNSRLAQYGYRKITCTDKETIYHNLVFFVTSEKYDYKSPRLYTIRRLNISTGEIITVGEFQQYKSSSWANKVAQKMSVEN